MTKIVTSTNNKYYFALYFKNECNESKEYTSKIDALQDFCLAMRDKNKPIWGQFICHHYKDE
ncbi:MAG: hypothetical protein KBT34_10695 [Prevotella sp.]|nr:hypothetical protein [Candidatus Prevotella equi]